MINKSTCFHAGRMVVQAIAIDLLGPPRVSKGERRFKNRRSPLETLGGAPRSKFGAGCWDFAKSDSHPAPHFITFQFAGF
ncbi:MAG: hypothetical protein R2825_10805 [Saprospiraceae bacterium]